MNETIFSLSYKNQQTTLKNKLYVISDTSTNTRFIFLFVPVSVDLSQLDVVLLANSQNKSLRPDDAIFTLAICRLNPAGEVNNNKAAKIADVLTQPRSVRNGSWISGPTRLELGKWAASRSRVNLIRRSCIFSLNQVHIVLPYENYLCSINFFSRYVLLYSLCKCRKSIYDFFGVVPNILN